MLDIEIKEVEMWWVEMEVDWHILGKNGISYKK